MSSQHEIRVGDKDPEMAAVKALGAALEPLDLDGRKRVLAWASDKFVDMEFRSIRAAAMEGILASMEEIRKRASELGVNERTLMHAISAVRDREGVAPIEKTPPHVIEKVAAEEERIARG